MKLIDAIHQLKGTPAIIPDCHRDNLIDFCVEMGYKVGAEIGVYKGAFTEKFCKAGIKMFAIDPWLSFGGQGRSQRRQERQNFLYEHTMRTLEPYKNCEVIRSTSIDTVRFFRRRGLDFVYIDGNHSFESVAQDIWYWSAKVRPGGMVAGHDYFNTESQARNTICHVGYVVDAYTKAVGIKNWYIFGKMENLITRDDRYHSWLWIKE